MLQILQARLQPYVNHELPNVQTGFRKGRGTRWHHPYDRKWRTKEPLVKVKEESEKVGLKLNIQKTKIMSSSPITSWQIDGETMGTVTDFIFLGSKITAYSDCSHEIKRLLLLGRKFMTNLDSILKSKDITLPTKVHRVKTMVFPVVMYGCESWTIKKARCQKIDAFELWCWERLLRVTWTTRRSNQSILKEISPECSLEGLMLKLKLWYFGHLMWRANSLEKTLMLRKIGHEFEQTPRDSEVQRSLACYDSWGLKESDTTERLNWTELSWFRANGPFSTGKLQSSSKSILLSSVL